MKNFTFRSLILCTTLLFLSVTLRSQQSLTQINGWNAYVHLPASYNSTTKSYPTIIFFPGLGEVGTIASKVILYGPGAYIAQGWDGNVVVDGNTIEFIVISLQPSAAYPNEVVINQKIQTIKSLYRVDPNRLHLTGLSHGGWCGSTFITGDPFGGPYTFASQIAAVVEVQGVIPDDNSPYPILFDNYAASGGKLLGFEQINDNRGVPTRVNRMNATVPNSATYIQTNFGSGGHCCWSQFYGGGGTQPGIFLLGGVNQNLYQWLGRQFRGSPTLPVSLNNFTGYKLGNSNILQWSTASEINNSGFEVQSSKDGINYIPIGFVNSQANGGNSTTELSYTFIDNYLTKKKQYYRLLQVDFDHNGKLSNIVQIKGEKPEIFNIECLFPNPANTIIYMQIVAPNKGKVKLAVTDIAGRTVFQQPVIIETGSNTIQIDVSRLIRGAYTVKLISGNTFDGNSTFLSSRFFVINKGN